MTDSTALIFELLKVGLTLRLGRPTSRHLRRSRGGCRLGSPETAQARRYRGLHPRPLFGLLSQRVHPL